MYSECAQQANVHTNYAPTATPLLNTIISPQQNMPQKNDESQINLSPPGYAK